MHPDTQFSARVAPPMIGLGLLESISDETLQTWADENEIKELSIGMSTDYAEALAFNPTYIRLGTILFGQRK